MSSVAVAAGSLSERLEAILPDIAGRSVRADHLRRVPDENVAALKEIGYLRAMVPAKYGGLELSVTEVARAARLLAQACPSTAWASQLLVVHAHAIASYDPRLQDEIWGDSPDATVSSSVAPVGKADRVDGGIRLSGRYSWSSGCEHAGWAVLGLMLEDEQGVRLPHFAVVPRSDYEIEDVWHSMGLRGTGSQDLVVSDAFVPDYRLESLPALNTGQATGFGTHPAPLYRLPFQPVFSVGFSVVVLGAAEALRDLYAERLQTRVRAYTSAKASASAPSYMRLAESTQELIAARRLLEGDWAEIDARAEAGEPATSDEFVFWRSNQAYATRMVVRAADRLFEASGGSAVLEKSRMQQLWRDIHTGAAHAYSDYDVAAQTLGAYLVGVAPAEGMF